MRYTKTRSSQYLLLTDAGHHSSEVRFLKANEPTGAWRLIAPHVDNVKYASISAATSSTSARRLRRKQLRVVTAPIANPGKENWKEFVASQPDVPLEDINLFRTSTWCRSGLQVRFFAWCSSGTGRRRRSIPGASIFATSGPNAEFKTGKIRYGSHHW